MIDAGNGKVNRLVAGGSSAAKLQQPTPLSNVDPDAGAHTSRPGTYVPISLSRSGAFGAQSEEFRATSY